MEEQAKRIYAVVFFKPAGLGGFGFEILCLRLEKEYLRSKKILTPHLTPLKNKSLTSYLIARPSVFTW